MSNSPSTAAQRRTLNYQNLMEPGSGTPWEDRGSLGIPKAFWQTCIMAMKQPATLFHQIRRPETISDARQFSILCSILWMVSWAGHGFWLEMRRFGAEKDQLINYQTLIFKVGLQSVLVFAAAFGFIYLFTRMHHQMVSSEMKMPAPKVLTYNLFSYCQGTALLALFPLIGPPVAIVWTAVLMMRASMDRLYLSKKGSVIAVMLCALLGLGIVLAAFAIQWLIWHNVGSEVIERDVAPAVPNL